VEDQEGQRLVGYAIIVALTAVIVIAALILLQNQISSLFSCTGNLLQ
jgi:Flp pilus assembly pilin Flp